MSQAGDQFEAAVQLHESGNLAAAAHSYREILRADPRHADAWHLLGVIAHQTNQPAQAVEYISRAIRLHGGVANFHHNLGEVYRLQGQQAEAEASYRQALRLAPDSVDSQAGLGMVLLAAGRAADAQTAIEVALRHDPRRAEWHNLLGNALRAQNKNDEAIKHYQQATVLRPDYAEGLANLGAALAETKRYTEAIELLQASLAISPTAAETHYNLGVALIGARKFAEAVPVLQQAVNLQPQVVEYRRYLGVAYAGLRDLPQARAAFEDALRRQPDFIDAMVNLGMLLKEHGYLSEALPYFQRVLELRPREEEVHNDLGCTLYELGLIDESERCFRTALNIKPTYPAGHQNLGMIHLARGQFEQGWAEQEWRDLSQTETIKSLAPRWRGSSLAGRSILLRPEQGLGDTVQFARYAALVAKSAARTFLEVQRPLVALMRQAGFQDVIAHGSELPDVDWQVPLLSLPYVMQTRADNIPAEVPYLQADPLLVTEWRARMSALQGFRIGINWQGNRSYSFDAVRSIPLMEFAALAEVPGITLISIQQKEGLDQLPPARERFTIHVLGEDVDTHRGAFMDTAAIMRNLDLIITSDTVTAHLAGALGVPVWTALALTPDWRWHFTRDDSPWYPTMRLFRQSALKDWTSVFQQMAQQLRNTVAPG